MLTTGQRIKAARINQRIPQDDLASSVGISRIALAKVEHDESSDYALIAVIGTVCQRYSSEYFVINR